MTEQTMTEYVTDAIYTTIDNSESLYTQVLFAQMDLFKRQYTKVRLYAYNKVIKGGKHHAKYLAYGNLDLRHFSPKLIAESFNIDYQDFITQQKEVADKLEKILPKSSIVQFLRMEKRFKYSELYSELTVTYDVLRFMVEDYALPCEVVSDIYRIMSTLHTWKTYAKRVILV